MSKDRATAIGELVAGLRTSASEARAFNAMDRIEDRLTPLELEVLAPDLAEFTGHAATAVERSRTLDLLKREPAQSYRRRPVAPSVEQFSAVFGARGDRSVVVIFCALGGRPLLPISLLVQLFPSDRFDLLLLRDPSPDGYRSGLPGLGNTLATALATLAERAALGQYRHIYTLGTSMGGVPALRAGLQLGAKRAVCVGGALFWPIDDTIRRDRLHDSFDLCPCLARPMVELVCVYAGDAFSDVASAMQIGHILPVELRPVRGCSQHNVLYALHRRGTLRRLLGQLFDFRGAPTRPASPPTLMQWLENLSGAQFRPGRLGRLPKPEEMRSAS